MFLGFVSVWVTSCSNQSTCLRLVAKAGVYCRRFSQHLAHFEMTACERYSHFLRKCAHRDCKLSPCDCVLPSCTGVWHVHRMFMNPCWQCCQIRGSPIWATSAVLITHIHIAITLSSICSKSLVMLESRLYHVSQLDHCAVDLNVMFGLPDLKGSVLPTRIRSKS